MCVCVCVCVCVSVCVSVCLPPINFWMPEPILIKLAILVSFLTNISTEPIQFHNSENCVRDELSKFDFKAVC
jgi:hypothetical protein